MKLGEVYMTNLVALSFSIGGLGLVATWLAVGPWSPLAGIFLIWAAFVAWGCYFATGADMEALKKTIAGNIFGSLIAYVAAILIVYTASGWPGGSPAPVWVGITVAMLVFASQIELLSSVPANVYGYACTFAYMMESGGLSGGDIFAYGFGNPFILVAFSMVIGALFGALSGRLAALMTKE